MNISVGPPCFGILCYYFDMGASFCSRYEGYLIF
jgi:hypothetical protein